MQRARQVRIVYRDSYLVSFRRMMKNKLVLASFVLIALGIVLFAASYQNSDVVNSKFIQDKTVTAVNGSYSDVYFVQPARLNSTISFSMSNNNITQYKIYGVDNYSTVYKAKSTTFLVAEGYAANGSTVQIDTNTGNPGQKYVIMVQSVGTNIFPVNVRVTSNIFLVEPSQKNIGGPGVMLGMAGSILLAARVSYIYRAIKML